MCNGDKRLLLLGLLRIQKMHGYQLQQFLDEHSGSLPSLKASTAYYTLEKMAKEGLVEAKSEREGNRPVRQVYCLTARGEEVFRRLLERNLSNYEIGEAPDDVGLAFLSSLPVEKARELLMVKRAKIERKLAEVSSTLDSLGKAKSLHLPLLRVRFRLEADLRWIESVVDAPAAFPDALAGGRCGT